MSEQKLRVYIAGSADNRSVLRMFADWVMSVNPNLLLTSTWIFEDVALPPQQRVQRDLEAILNSDLVLGTYPWGQGTASELAYAAGKGIPVLYYRLNLLDSDGSEVYSKEDDPFITWAAIDEQAFSKAVLSTQFQTYYSSGLSFQFQLNSAIVADVTSDATNPTPQPLYTLVHIHSPHTLKWAMHALAVTKYCVHADSDTIDKLAEEHETNVETTSET